MFGLVSEDLEESYYFVPKMIKEKLESASIHNLSAERSVGFINCELKI